MQENLSYLVPIDRLEHVRSHLDKIIKRAAKKGLSTLSYEVGTEPQFQSVAVPFFDPFEPEKDYKVVQIECREVSLSAPTLKLAGWSFVGRIEHLKTDDGVANLIYNAPGTEVPIKYREREQLCDHCKVNRYRKDTFIVQHDNGETKQVGSTCLSDFLGVDASRFLAWASLIQVFTGSLDDKWNNESGGRQSRAYPLWQILDVAAASYMDRGYVSRDKAYETDSMATADVISSYLTAKTDKERNALITPCPSEEWKIKGKNLAKEAEEFVLELATRDFADLDNDYLCNLAVVGKAGFCPWKAVGILGSAIVAVERDKERRNKNAENLNSKHQGVIKHRIVVEDATVILARPFEGMYGSGIIYRFRADGNLYTWFASNHNTSLDVDDVVSFVATVKKHDTDKYAGGAEVTIVNRLNDDKAAVAKAKKKLKKELAKTSA